MPMLHAAKEAGPDNILALPCVGVIMGFWLGYSSLLLAMTVVWRIVLGTKRVIVRRAVASLSDKVLQPCHSDSGDESCTIHVNDRKPESFIY